MGISRIQKYNVFECNSCRYQFSVTSGTIFHDSHLPLWKWFLATYMMAEAKKGVSANQIKRTIGVSSSVLLSVLIINSVSNILTPTLTN